MKEAGFHSLPRELAFAFIGKMTDKVLLISEDLQLVYANPSAIAAFHIDLSERISVEDLLSDLFSNYGSDTIRLLADGLIQRQSYMGRWESIDGKLFEIEAYPVDEPLKGGWIIFRDLTAQKIWEERIKASEEKYRGIIENMELGLMEVDREGVIMKVYDRFCDLTDYTPDELIGKDAEEIFLPEEFQDTMDKQSAMRLEGQSGVYEIQMIKKGGERIWVLISGAPIFDDVGEVIGSIGIHYDISYIKKMQNELIKAKDKAEAARDAEKDFLANMSHEIRNPINAIIGMSYLMNETPLNPEQQDYLDAIQHSSNILLTLVSDILDITKIQDGKMELSPTAVSLHELCDAMASNARFRLGEKNVDFIYQFDPKINESLLLDPGILNQVLLNLLNNAIKFTENGSVQFLVNTVERETSKQTIKFEVIDTGIGIREENLSLVFERFKQADRETKLTYGGSGLGLFITRQLVDLMGGRISLESRYGHGTSFTVELSFSRVDNQLLQQEQQASPDSSSFPSIEKVLIVEDNPLNQRYLSGLFKKWGVSFHLANNGEAAVALCDSNQYELILMDIRMPKMDGYQASRTIRSGHSINATCPIIALTASALTDEREKALEAGMDAHLSKPFNPDQLALVIMQLLDTGRTENLSERKDFSFNDQLDQEMLDSLYEGDLAYALLMFETFSEIIQGELEALTDAVEQEQWELVEQLAHRIKPNFSMVGLSPLSAICHNIEKALKEEQDIGGVNENYPELLKKFPESLLLIDREIERLKLHLVDTA